MRKFIVAALLALSCPAFAATHPLTDTEVQAAIDAGMKGHPHIVGLMLNDKQTAFLSAMACATCGQSGYTIQIFTPAKWIEEQAMLAKKEMMPFSLADVSPEMRRPVLRVVALPSQANYINGRGLSLSSNVHRVVLQDKNHNTTIQPMTNDNGSVEGNSAFRSVSYATASATFDMADVDAIRGGDDGEFFVVVVGDNQNKYFKVKTRMLKKLF